MKQSALFAFLSVVFVLPAHACDFCHALYGINPSFTSQNRLMVNQLYQRSRFGGIAQNAAAKTSGLPTLSHAGHGSNLLYGYREQRLSVELAYQHLFGQKYMVQVALPLLWNEVSGTNSYNILGNGDLQLTGYRILKPYEKLDGALTILAGGGFKLPSGPTRLRDDSGARLPMHAQPGSGSVDALTHIAAFYQFSKHTIAADFFGKWNSTAFGYRRGNSGSASIVASRDAMRSFYRQLAIIPSAGWRYEVLGADRTRGVVGSERGSQAHYAVAGMLFISGPFRFQTSWLFPVVQLRDDFSPREIPRFTLSLQRVFP
jgi:hypothetical protein